MTIKKKILAKIKNNQYNQETLSLSEHEPALTEQDVLDLSVALKSNSHIKKIELRHCNVKDSWLKILSSVKSIESLDIFNNLITDEGLVYLLDMPLKKLQIGGNDRIKSLEVLCQHESLEVLIANHCENLDSIKGFVANVKVRILGLSYCGIKDEELERIAENNFIEELFLSSNFLTSKGITYIAKNTTIKALDVSLSKLDNESAIILSKMSSLEKLNIHGNLINDAGVAALAKQTKIKVLDASSLKLTLESCKALSKNESLTELNISTTQLEDDEISLLVKMSNLKKLLAVYNPITEAGISTLEKSHIETIDVSSLDNIGHNKFQTLFFGFNINKERIREDNVRYEKTRLNVVPLFKSSCFYTL